MTSDSLPPRISHQDLVDLAKSVLSGGSGRIEIEAPFTAKRIGAVPLSSAEDVQAAVVRARGAQPEWSRVPPGHRARMLKRLHRLVLKHRETIMDLVQLEAGKARRDAFEEVVDVLNNARYYAHTAPALLKPVRHQSLVPRLVSTRGFRHPWGVVGIISPWNYPLVIAISDALAALAAGNSVVLKPSELTPYTPLLVSRLLAEAGLPEHVFTVVTGDGTTGRALVDQVDYIRFTGSSPVGRDVGARAGARLIASSLELGGKNPMIVRSDAGLKPTVEGAARGCFANAGQLCMAMERVYVHRSLFDDFVDRLARRAARLKLSPAYDYSADIGSLISDDHVQRVARHIMQASRKGATVVTGGARRPDIGPNFYTPAVLTGVRPGMQIHAEETFGPVAAVYPFDDDEEAVALANDSPYGLLASIWSKDVKTAVQMAKHVKCGSVGINESYAAVWFNIDAPMGGMKDSGYGYRHGAEGLMQFVQLQSVSSQRRFPSAGRLWNRPRSVTKGLPLIMRVFNALKRRG